MNSTHKVHFLGDNVGDEPSQDAHFVRQAHVHVARLVELWGPRRPGLEPLETAGLGAHLLAGTVTLI